MLDSNQIANWNRVLFDAFVGRAAAANDARAFDEALQSCSVAAWFASRKGWFGQLSSRELETQIMRAAESLPIPKSARPNGARKRWLHVLTEAYATLGHTNLCRRWIQYDSEVVHDIILTDQRGEAPSNLVEAVKQAHGDCVVLDASLSPLERARQLRAYAWQNADVVVLHIHPEDVMATAALGVAGGPPVLLVNHADHSFWVGCTVADLVLDIRQSGHSWTTNERGVKRAAILPLPLLESAFDVQGPDHLERKQAARLKLGLPVDGTVMLTVGSAAKYDPITGLDFVETALRILQECPDARLLAVGPEDVGAWRDARHATSGRLTAVGRQPDSRVYCQAADLYLEGFPAGSLTALLEAGEAGLACVRAPRDIIPPFASDGLAFEQIKQPGNVQDYVREAVSLINNSTARNELGQNLQKEIRAHYGRTGWLARLRQVKELIPGKHNTYANFEPKAVEVHRRNWLVEYLHAKGPPLHPATVAEELFVEAWRRTSGAPELDTSLWAALNPTSGLSAGGSDPAALRRLNNRIRRRGSRARLIAAASHALRQGSYSLARNLAWLCLLRNVSSIADQAWLKVMVKTHLGPGLSAYLRGMKNGQPVLPAPGLKR